MLSEIRVSGFKSLTDFDLSLNAGLNVLVGPNGAGKTNIIRFFDFLAYLQRYSLPEAVSKAGGAGEIFRRVGEQTLERNLKVRLRGSGKQFDHWTSATHEPREVYIAYQLEFLIHFSEVDNRLYYDSQSLQVKTYPRAVPKTILLDTVAWDMNLHYDTVSSALDWRHRDGYKIDDRTKRYMERYRALWKEDTSIREHLINTWLSRYMPFYEKISEDLASGSSYNIVPSRVREPEDIAQPPIINPDGTGLAATLYQLKNATLGNVPSRMFSLRRTRFDSTQFMRVRDYFLLVNPGVIDIDVRNDPFENKLKVFVTMRLESNEIQIPLSLLSDGTIKWLALVTALSTSVSYFAIEEPENYIHPKMQHEFASIVRTAC